MNPRQARKHAAEVEKTIAKLLGPLGEPVLLAVPGLLWELTGSAARSPRLRKPARVHLAVTPTRMVLAGNSGGGKYAATVPYPLLALGELDRSSLSLQWIEPDLQGMHLDFESDDAREFFAALKQLRDEQWMRLPRSGQIELTDHSYGHDLHFRRNPDPAVRARAKEGERLYLSGEVDAAVTPHHLGIVSSPLDLVG